MWHCPKIKFTGFPEGPGYPTAAAVQARLSCKPGKPVSTLDIEGDVVRLQETGLFKTVTPAARSGSNRDAPMFWVIPGDEDPDSVALDAVPPLAEIEFKYAIQLKSNNVPLLFIHLLFTKQCLANIQ